MEKHKPNTLLVIDLQNDFCQTNSVYHKLGYPVKQNQVIARKIDQFINAIQSEFNIFFILSHYDSFFIKGKRINFCQQGTFGAQSYLNQELADEIIIKTSHDGFQQTNLDQLLQLYQTKKVYLTGISLPVCVESTARSAVNRGYNTTIISDLVTYRDESLKKVYLQNFSDNIGFVKTVREIYGY